MCSWREIGGGNLKERNFWDVKTPWDNDTNDNKNVNYYLLTDYYVSGRLSTSIDYLI